MSNAGIFKWQEIFRDDETVISHRQPQDISIGVDGPIVARLIMLTNIKDPNDIIIRWIDLTSNNYMLWKLLDSKLKYVSPTNFTIKVMCIQNRDREKIQLSFSSKESANNFSAVYKKMPPINSKKVNCNIQSNNYGNADNWKCFRCKSINAFTEPACKMCDMPTKYQIITATALIAVYNMDLCPLFNFLRNLFKDLFFNPKSATISDESHICRRGVLELLKLFSIMINYRSAEIVRNLSRPSNKTFTVTAIRDVFDALYSYQFRFGIGDMILCKDQSEFVTINTEIRRCDEAVVWGYIRQYNTCDYIPNALIQLFVLFYSETAVTLERNGQIDWSSNEYGVVLNSNNSPDPQNDAVLKRILYWAICKHVSDPDSESTKTVITAHKLFSDSTNLIQAFRELYMDYDIDTNYKIVILESVNLWMKLFWKEDFMNNTEMQKLLENWSISEGKIATIYNQFITLNENSTSVPETNVKGSISIIEKKKREQDSLLLVGFLRRHGVSEIMQNVFDILLIFYNEPIAIPASVVMCKLDTDIIADQFTLITHELMNSINDRECLKQNWKRERDKAGDVLAVIKNYNNLYVFIQNEILKQTSVNKRGKMIKSMIKMGQRFLKWNNYDCLSATVAALDSAPIYRQKGAWSKVSDSTIDTFQEFKKIFSRDHGYRNYRKVIRNMKDICIPRFGMLLQDLIFIDDGLAVRESFNKMIRTMHQIRSFKRHLKGTYEIKQNLVVQKAILLEFEKLGTLTDDDIWDMSIEAKKNDKQQTGRLLSFLKNKT